MAEDWEEETSTGFSFSGQVTFLNDSATCYTSLILIMGPRVGLVAPTKALEGASTPQKPSRSVQVQ
jgi:hypothetical protein